MTFSFERLAMKFCEFFIPRHKTDCHTETSPLLLSVPEVVLLEMWQARKRGLCTWYALVRERCAPYAVNNPWNITETLSSRDTCGTRSRFSDHDGEDVAGCKRARNRNKCLAPFISRCISSSGRCRYSPRSSFSRRANPANRFESFSYWHYWRSMARFKWKWIRYGVGCWICRRMRDCFREERDRKKIISRYVLRKFAGWDLQLFRFRYVWHWCKYG